ncbi:Putative transposase (identified by ISEscan HMM) [Klebsiella pneumoniae]|nr:Putative transposase (identified by ISEscan HMM) [Klebsiella pneumoniae]
MDLNFSVADYPFQFAMIVFNHVVPVLNLSVQRQTAPAFAFEQSKRATIGGRFIRVDESWIRHFFTLLRILTNRGAALLLRDGGRDKIDSAALANDGLV